MLRLLIVTLSLAFSVSAYALTDNAPPATGWEARPIVMLIDARGDLCTGTALARNLVLTTAHCVMLPIEYRVRVFQNGANLRRAHYVPNHMLDYGRQRVDNKRLEMRLVAPPLVRVIVRATI